MPEIEMVLSMPTVGLQEICAVVTVFELLVRDVTKVCIFLERALSFTVTRSLPMRDNLKIDQPAKIVSGRQ